MPRKGDTRRKLEELVGVAEAGSYLRIVDACRASTQSRFGGIDVLDVHEVGELGGDFRPGLVAFARDGAGDYLCWDLRRGQGAPAAVLYCDHELGIAVPIACGVDGALVHVFARAAVGVPGRVAAANLEQWSELFASVLAPAERKRLAELAVKARRAGNAPLFARLEAMTKALRDLVPAKARGGLCTLPPTHVPLLRPEDPGCLEAAARRYEESAATYREMLEDEGRAAFGWHLANALRGLADVLLRRGRDEAALRAAREAVTLYEPIYVDGDARVETHLAFAHRVVAVVEARKRRYAVAFDHAERALALSESSLAAAAAMLHAASTAVDAWNLQRAGGPIDDVRLRIEQARKWSAPYLEREPPHPLRAHAEAIVRLAAKPAKRARMRRVRTRR
ncbi:MAG: hypothetical protein K0S65_1224 [Labilithrix sp.]|nr:hypothetical protein [Labilithrix sp.]